VLNEAEQGGVLADQQPGEPARRDPDARERLERPGARRKSPSVVPATKFKRNNGPIVGMLE